MKEYFYKKQYICLYLSKFCYSLGNSLIDIYGTVMLYKNGMSIATILFVYGLRFGIMGALSPLFLKISTKKGVATCALIANIFRIICSYMLLFRQTDNMILFIIFMGIPGALSNPIANAITNRYVESEHKGKYNSGINIAKILGTAVASGIVTYGVVSQNELFTFIIISIFFLLDYLFTGLIDYKPTEKPEKIYSKTLNYIMKSKSELKLIYSLRTFQIVERFFVPLYLYLALKDLVLFTTVILVSLSIQVFMVLVTGKLSDKDRKKTNTFVTAIRMIVSAIFLIIKNKWIISFNKTVYDNLGMVYETTFNTSIQEIIKDSKNNDALLSTVCEMCLCFTEIIVFSVLAIISIFIGEKIFILIFMSTIISLYIMNKKINNGLNVQNQNDTQAKIV